MHLEGAELLTDLRLCTALAPTLSGNKKPGRCHALANIAGAAAGVRSNCQSCYTSRLPRIGSRATSVRRFGRLATVLAGSPL
jgi:hypothetical protein